MLSFENDYAEGAHPLILQRLLETNRVQQPGYGEDAYCQSAKEKIRIACGSPEMEIFFLTGGTQTNQVVIDGMLRGVEGVVSAVSGHVNCHEAGAIEYTGHKVITLPEYQGKIKAEDLSILLRDFYCDPAHAHMVYPGMVYISHPTEWGTLYTRKELAALHDVCQHAHIPLFVDGARLGYGLMSDETDVTLKDLCQYADVFSPKSARCAEKQLYSNQALYPRIS